MVNPNIQNYGIVAIFFSLLGGIILFSLHALISPTIRWLLIVLFPLIIIFGIVMIIVARSEDPKFIHSFARRGEDELYHVLTWIPVGEVEFLPFPDNYSPSKILENRKIIFKDIADFIRSDRFLRCVESKIDGETSVDPFSRHIIVRRMLDPEIILEKRGYEMISYRSETDGPLHMARLSRKNEAFIRLSRMVAEQSQQNSREQRNRKK